MRYTNNISRSAVLSVATAVAVAALSSDALLGRVMFVADASPQEMCRSGCASMPETTRASCLSGCDSMGSGGGGNYTPPPSTGGSYTPPAGNMSPDACKAGCTIGNMPNATPEMLASCMRGCDSMGTSGGMGGGGTSCSQPQPTNWPDCQTISCVSNMWSCTVMKSGAGGGYTAPGSGMTGGGYTVPGSGGQSPYDMCKTNCGSNSDCVTRYCDPMLPRSASSVSSTMSATNGGTSGTERCFVSATWKRTDGSTFGGSLSCTRNGTSWTDCREFTENGASVSNANVSKFEGSTSCYLTGGTSGTTGGGSMGSNASMNGGMMGGSMMKNCTYPRARIRVNGQSTDASVTCEGDYINCRGPSGTLARGDIDSLGAPSACDSGWNGGGMNGGTDPYAACNMVCTDPSKTTEAKRPECTRQCDTQFGRGMNGGMNGGGYMGGSGPQQYRCKYPNGKTLWCTSPHVNCSESQNNGVILTSYQVGANGGTADCVMEGSTMSVGANGEAMQRNWNNSSMGQYSSYGTYMPMPNTTGVYIPQYNVTSQCDNIRAKIPMLSDMPELQDQAKALLTQCEQGGKKTTKTTADQGNQLRTAVEQIQQQVYVQNACNQVKQSMQEADHAMTVFAPQMMKKVKSKTAFEKLQSLLETGRSILSDAQNAVQQNQCDKAISIMDTMQPQVGDPFQQIVMNAGVNGGDTNFVDYADNVATLSENLASDGGNNSTQIATTIKARGYDKGQTIALLSTIDRSVIQEYLNATGDKQGGADALNVAVQTGLGATDTEDLLKTKNALLKEITDLQNTAKNLKADVQASLAMIKNYIFDPSVQADASALIADAATLSAKELQARFDVLKTKSNTQAWGFGDVNGYGDHSWAAAHIKATVQAGLFKGVDASGKEFAPDQSANVAQVMTVVARALDVNGDGSSPVSTIAKNSPAWAQSAASGLEDNGVDLATIFEDSKPGDAATRIEIARLITSAFSLPEGDTSAVADYKDVQGLSEEDQLAVATVVEAGIMTGTDGAFDPDGIFNRAQFATVMDRVLSWENADQVSASGGTTPSQNVSNTTGQSAETSSETTHAAAPAKPTEPSMNLNEMKESDVNIARAVVAQWIGLHKRTDPLYNDAVKTQKELDSFYTGVISGYKSTIGLTFDVQNQLSDERFKTLKKILIEQEMGAAQ